MTRSDQCYSGYFLFPPLCPFPCSHCLSFLILFPPFFLLILPHFPLLSFSHLSTFPPSFCILPLSLHLCFSFFFPTFSFPSLPPNVFPSYVGLRAPLPYLLSPSLLLASFYVCLLSLPHHLSSFHSRSLFLDTISSASFPHPSVLSSSPRTPSISAPHPDRMRRFIRSYFFVSFEVKTHFLEFPGQS